MRITLQQLDNIKVPNDEEESGIKRFILKGSVSTGICPFNPHKVLEKLPYDLNDNI